MENWIGAYRLPNQTASLGVDRGGGTGEGNLEGGVSPIPGSTPSPNLLNMWNHAIKVETSSHGLPGSHPNNQGGSIKGETLEFRIPGSFLSIVGEASNKFIDANKPFLSDIEKGGSFFVADDHLVVVGRGRVVNLWVVAHSCVVFCLLSFVFLRLISLDVGHLQQGGQP